MSCLAVRAAFTGKPIVSFEIITTKRWARSFIYLLLVFTHLF